MKKIPIKFRGRFWLKGLDPSDINTRLSDGDFVFGGYARMKFLFDDDDGDYIIQNDSTAFLVYPNSVSQLVGYDDEGKEVYEGDTVDAFFGTSKKPSHNFPAALSSNIETPTDLDFKFIRRN